MWKNIPAECEDLSSFIYTCSKETVFHVELKYFLTDSNLYTRHIFFVYEKYENGSSRVITTI